jgi:hypothetical protein
VCLAVTSAAVSAAASYSEPGSERLAVSAGSEHASECRQRDPSVHERGSERRAVDRRQVTHSGSRPKNCVSSLLVCPVVIAIDEDLRESARVYVLVHACTNCKYITVHVPPRNGCVSVLLDIEAPT